MNITMDDWNFLMGYSMNKFTPEDRDWAEDLVQTTMMKAIRSKDKYCEMGNLRGYLIRILTNTFINEYNKIKRARKAHNGYIAHSRDVQTKSVHPTDPPDEFFEPEIQLILDVMNQDQLDVLLLFVKGRSYEEIAKDLSIPVGTVMSRLYRARQFFRRESEIKNMDDYYKQYPEHGEGWPDRYIQNRATKPHRFD